MKVVESTERVGLEGSLAVARAVQLADVDVIAAYPITPQTHIVESLAEMVANGHLKAEYIPVESEHSAMSACLGSSAAGARTFTATAGQGLELMHEVLYVASSLRLPIVMVVADRALSGPLNVWGDHSDAMATRDCGWIQMFAENAQQAFDMVLCAFKIAEDLSVLFPVMVHIDGFQLSHVVEPLVMLNQETVTRWLPPYKHPFALDPAKPVTVGAYAPPFVYTETKKAQDVALRGTKKNILKVWKDYADLTGRAFLPVESYCTEGAETLLLTMGSFSETAMSAIDRMQAAGQKVGLVRIRLWRPFPFEEFRAAVSGAKNLIVLDRALSLGGPAGPVYSEVQSALYNVPSKPKVISFVGGLGGRDISIATFENIVNKGIEKAKANRLDEFEIIEVRE